MADLDWIEDETGGEYRSEVQKELQKAKRELDKLISQANKYRDQGKEA